MPVFTLRCDRPNLEKVKTILSIVYIRHGGSKCKLGCVCVCVCVCWGEVADR